MSDIPDDFDPAVIDWEESTPPLPEDTEDPLGEYRDPLLDEGADA